MGARLSLEHATERGTVALHGILLRRDDRQLIVGEAGTPWEAHPPLPAGSRLIARADLGTATLVAELEVVGSTPQGELVVQAPTLVERFAKRRYHRSAVDLPLTVGSVACQILDLSGCGLLALCPASAGIQRRDIVKGILRLETAPTVQLTMYAVRTGEGPLGSKLIGFDFLEISEHDQDRIIGYVLRQERKRLQALRGL